MDLPMGNIVFQTHDYPICIHLFDICKISIRKLHSSTQIEPHFYPFQIELARLIESEAIQIFVALLTGFDLMLLFIEFIILSIYEPLVRNCSKLTNVDNSEQGFCGTR